MRLFGIKKSVFASVLMAALSAVVVGSQSHTDGIFFEQLHSMRCGAVGFVSTRGLCSLRMCRCFLTAAFCVRVFGCSVVAHYSLVFGGVSGGRTDVPLQLCAFSFVFHCPCVRFHTTNSFPLA